MNKEKFILKVKLNGGEFIQRVSSTKHATNVLNLLKKNGTVIWSYEIIKVG